MRVGFGDCTQLIHVNLYSNFQPNRTVLTYLVLHSYACYDLYLNLHIVIVCCLSNMLLAAIAVSYRCYLYSNTEITLLSVI